MNTKIVIPNQRNKMSVMKGLVGKKISKNVKFMGDELKITKLTVAEVISIQELAKERKDTEDGGGLDLLKEVIKLSVDEAKDLSEDDFKSFPMDELRKLSDQIMEFSGMAAEGKK